MPTLYHLEKFLATERPRTNLFVTAAMVFFFVTFDGTLMYLAPIVMNRSGIEEGMMGLILGLSSVAGLLFDVVLSRLIENVTYRTMFFVMLVAAATYPFFLFGATTVTMYLIAMAVWGLYYNFYNMGTIDYVEQTTTTDEYPSYFGVLKVFDGLGNLVAPFFGSILLIIAASNLKMLPWALAILVPAFLCYFILFASQMRDGKKVASIPEPSVPFFEKMRVWRKITWYLLPVLLLTLTINLVDSAVWTIGPIFSESLSAWGKSFGGAFMIAYTLPPILVGWLVGRFVDALGKKQTAIGALFIGSCLLTLLGFVTAPLALMGMICATSFCFALAWPTINSAYADDIALAPHESKGIEGVEDLFTNLGDTLGPIAGGFAAQYVGFAHAFTLLGFFGATAALFLFWYTPSLLITKLRYE
jgi:predicted MFS family arabinose efflux permease